MNSFDLLSTKQLPPDFAIQSIPRNMEENPKTGWHRQIFFFGPTSFLDELCIHAGVLSAHVAPHPPHCHEHEEVHVSLAETLEFVVCGAGSDIETIKPIDNESVFFTDSKIPHTFRNAASSPAAYLHFRWKNESKTSRARKEPLQFYYSPLAQNKTCGHSVYNGVEIDEIYTGPSLYLSHLRAIFIKLQAGDVIPLHRHPHEVIFVLVSGSIETLGRKLDAPGFAFLGTQVPHHITNRGPDSAHLYAFELHREV